MKTSPVRDAHRFDEGALALWLREHVSDFGGELEVRQFTTGQSNPTFHLRAEGLDLVLRKKPPGELLPSAHQVEREYRVMRALEETEVPVPRTVALCEDDEPIGTPFFLMEHVPGRVFFDPSFADATPDDRAGFHAELVRVLGALHRVDPDAVGLSDFGRAGNYYERQISRWARQYASSKTEEIESMERLSAWLPANVPAGADEPPRIVHGDFRLDNLLFDAREPRALALIDWELSTLGHPLADLAYLCTPYHIDTPFHRCLDRVAGGTSGIPTEEEVVAEYCRATGRGGIPDWSFYLAFSLFRIAGILQGVYKRGLQGNASSESALAVGRIARRAGDAAWTLVE